MDFNEQKNQIIGLMKRGDKKTIAKVAGVSTVTVWNSLNKSSVTDMTAAEKRAWITAVEFINARISGNNRIEKQTSKVAEKMKQRILVPQGKKKQITSELGAAYLTVRNALNGNSNSLLSNKIRQKAIEVGGEYEREREV